MKIKLKNISKKIIAIILSALLLFSAGAAATPVVAQAVTTQETSWHSLHRFTVNKQDAFCIHFNGVARGKTIAFKTNSEAKKYWKKLGTSKQNKINKILTTANELGYLNSSSNAKYFAVQRAIWNVTDGKTVETKNTTNMKKFRSETQKYFDKLQKTYPSNNTSKKPNLPNTTLNYSNNYSGKVADKNKVLSDWQISDSAGFRTSISGNNISIDGSDVGGFSGKKTIKLKRKKPVYNITANQVGRFNDQEAIMTAGAYSIPTTSFSVNANTPLAASYGAIQIKKVDENNNPIKGVKFAIKYKEDNEGDVKSIIITTDENGIATTSTDFSSDITNALKVYVDNDKTKDKIQYAVQEIEYDDNSYIPLNKVEAVTGITLTENETVDVSNIAGKDVWTNVQKRGDLKIIKEVESSEDNVPGEGFSFTLEGTSDTGMAVSYESTTDENGEAYMCNIPVGTYTLSEKEDSRFVKLDSQKVTIEWDGKASAENYSTNKEDYQESKTVKYIFTENGSASENTDNELENAEVSDDSDETIDVEEGEDKADSADYIPSNVFKFVNKYKRGDLKIEKLEEYVADNSLKIDKRKGQNFEFNVTSDKTKNITGTDLSYSVKTDENGEAYLCDIPIGTYTITEVNYGPQFIDPGTVTIPVLYDNTTEYKYTGLKNYGTSSSEFNSEDSQTTTTLTNKLAIGSIKGIKTDESKNPLQGVKFGLYYKNDSNQKNDSATYTEKNALMTVLTKDDGSFEFKNVPYGEYYVVELSTKEGYVLSNTPIAVNIKEDGEVVNLSVVNKKVKGEIQITKTDATTGKTIPNCKIEILDSNKKVIYQGTTDKNGVVKFSLGYGTYYYREYEAPNGYILDTTPHMFKISKDGQIIKAVMTNDPVKKKEVKHIKTGSTIFWMLLGAGGMIAVAAVLILSSKKKNKKNN